MSENAKAWALWSEFLARKPYPSDLIPILQKGESEVRSTAWEHFTSLKPSRQFIIAVIEQAPDFQSKAWDLLWRIHSKPSTTELLHVIEHAESLREGAWKALTLKDLSEKDLLRVIRVAPSLRKMAFAAFVLLRPFQGVLEQLKRDVPEMTEMVDSVLSRPKGAILTDLLAEL